MKDNGLSKPALMPHNLPVIKTSRRLVVFACLALLTATCLPASFTTAGQAPVAFILSGDAPVYSRVASVTEQFVRDNCPSSQDACSDLTFTNQPFDTSDIADVEAAALTISLGTKATNWIEHIPNAIGRISAMLPYRHIKGNHQAANRAIAEIFIDQPYTRYFQLIKSTIPRASRVGLLIHESDMKQNDTIRKIANENGYILKTSIVNSEQNVGEALSYLLNDSDVLLALPDARIHNSQTISHILTTAYRNNIPVIGFSSAYVKAGATAAVYTSPENIAHQISDAIIEFLSTGKVEHRFQKARYYSVTFNFEVARSLGLPPMSPSAINQALSEGAGK